MIESIIYWLSERVTMHYAKAYIKHVDERGLPWVLGLLDDDIETYGHPYVHTLAKAGCIKYSQRREGRLQ